MHALQPCSLSYFDDRVFLVFRVDGLSNVDEIPVLVLRATLVPLNPYPTHVDCVLVQKVQHVKAELGVAADNVVEAGVEGVADRCGLAEGTGVKIVCIYNL